MRAVVLVYLLVATVGVGQGFRPPSIVSDEFSSMKPSTAPTSSTSDYRIGSDDQLDIEVFENTQLATTSRVSSAGLISLKLIGPVQAGGLTTQQLEKVIEKALREGQYLNEPHVTVAVREYASQPVAIMGAVRVPGIYQIKGQKTLFSMISAAQGFEQSTVGRTIQVIRAPKTDGAPRETVAIDIEDFQRGSVELDIPIYANDTINVQTAGSVFVVGEVMQPDEFTLRNGKDISVLQALSKSGGTTKDARKSKAMIIRYHEEGKREEIPLDIDKILAGKSSDIQMMANDILFVPPNKARAAFNRSLESTISVVTGRLIYRF